MGEKLPRILPKVATFTSLLGSFICCKFITWDRRLYFPSEGRRAEDIFARKIRRLRPGLNPQIWVPEASKLTSRPPEPLKLSDFTTLLEATNDSIMCSLYEHDWKQCSLHTDLEVILRSQYEALIYIACNL